MSISLVRSIVAGLVALAVAYLVFTGKATWTQFGWVLALLFTPSPIRLDPKANQAPDQVPSTSIPVEAGLPEEASEPHAQMGLIPEDPLTKPVIPTDSITYKDPFK
jgi:hypothetical protein